ncbi:MAG: S1C family serine protease [Pirellulales bacterium]|nr:S1C family serine protease [Pirellulales bacterium]
MNKKQFFAAPLFALAVATGLSSPLPRASGNDLAHLEQQAMQAAAAQVADSVVRIQCVGGSDRVGGVSLGKGPCTGLVVSPEGLIVSSRYNFARRPTSILVQLPGGLNLPARLLGADESRGLVLLKVDLPQGTPPLMMPEWAEAGSAVPGAWALAIGRTLDAEQVNLSVGIVSAVDRIWDKAIQTDAKISPNNYGGPLVDIHGRVMGLLVPLSPERDGNVAGAEWYDSGIGFAIPHTYLQQVLPRLKTGEILRPGFLGISLKKDSNLFGIPPQVQAVHPDSPAAASGLRVGDTIVAVNRQPVANIVEFKYQIKPLFAGNTVRLLLLRGEQQFVKEVGLAAASKIRWIKDPKESRQKPSGPQPPKPPKPHSPQDRDRLDRI